MRRNADPCFPSLCAPQLRLPPLGPTVPTFLFLPAIKAPDAPPIPFNLHTTISPSLSPIAPFNTKLGDRLPIRPKLSNPPNHTRRINTFELLHLDPIPRELINILLKNQTKFLIPCTPTLLKHLPRFSFLSLIHKKPFCPFDLHRIFLILIRKLEYRFCVLFKVNTSGDIFPYL